MCYVGVYAGVPVSERENARSRALLSLRSHIGENLNESRERFIGY